MSRAIFHGAGPAVVSLLLLTGCGDLFPWHEPTARIYISAPLPQCPATDTLCLVLTQLPADDRLLDQLGSDTAVRRNLLNRATGVPWKEQSLREPALHLQFQSRPVDEGRRSIYVLEAVRAATAHDSVLSIASNGGTVVWLNGELLGASRASSRPARRHQDLYTAQLRQGINLVLYRLLDNGTDPQLHREWHARASLPDLVSAAIDLGAYGTLARTPLLPDTAASLRLWPSSVHLKGGPVVSFSWRTLLGDSLADGGRHEGGIPDSLSLPAGFTGMAVLRTEVLDANGRRLYLEECPIFRDSTAKRLARTLASGPVGTDPIRAARVAAVRAAFNLGPGPDGPALDAWLTVQTLASLYRHVRQPEAFQRYIGPQVWGYRADDGSVQPYWLTVPPSAAEQADSTGYLPGLVFSVTHHIDPDFWAGRGRVSGFAWRLAAMGSSYGNFGVMPHLRGVHDFDSVAMKEVPGITHQVDSVFGIDTAAVGMLAWSSHALEAVQMAHDPRVPIAWLGLAVPPLYSSNDDLTRALDSLYRIRPRLHWLVWQADLDSVVKREHTERWVRQVREKGFDTRYRLVPYSTHLGGYFEDVEADLHRSIANRFRGANERALRDSLAGGAPASRQ